MLAALLLLPFATPALATDGILEINQTCAVETGCFAGDTAGLPVLITEPGSYRLTSNLIVPDDNTSGILVGASDVSVDLNSFSILGPVTCSGSPVTCTPSFGTGSGVERVSLQVLGTSVKNGSITGMGRYGVFLSAQAEVSNLRVRWNRIDGISVHSGSTVSGNTAFQNGNRGIYADSGSTVSGNSSSANADDGIYASDGSTVSANTARLNGRSGIGGGPGSVIIGNTSTFNGRVLLLGDGHGILCTGGCLVRGNSVRDNTGYGLSLGTGSAYSANVMTNNATGTVSGGTAAATPAQNYCDGVNTPQCP